MSRPTTATSKDTRAKEPTTKNEPFWALILATYNGDHNNNSKNNSDNNKNSINNRQNYDNNNAACDDNDITLARTLKTFR